MSGEVAVIDFLGMSEGPQTLSDDLKFAMISEVEETGSIDDAATLLGVQRDVLQITREADPNFNMMIEQAEARLKIRLRKRIYDLAFEDREVPIVGGPDKDIVVDHEIKTQERMVELAAKLALGEELVQRTKNANLNVDAKHPLAGNIDTSKLNKKDEASLRRILIQLNKP